MNNIPCTCVCEEVSTFDHAIISKEDRFVIKRHDELRDLEAEPLNMIWSDVEGETVPQNISREQLKVGDKKVRRLNLVILASGFCETQRSGFFDVGDRLQMLNPVRTRVPNRQCSRRVIDIEHETLTPNWKNGRGMLEILRADRFKQGRLFAALTFCCHHKKLAFS